MRVLIGRVPQYVPATAPGWRVACLPERTYPALVAADATALGMTVDGLTADDWRVIDAFEDALYDLKPLSLSDGRHGWAYVCPDAAKALATTWNPERFATEHLANYVDRCAAWRMHYAERKARDDRADLIQE
jgi:hypothetical protein